MSLQNIKQNKLLFHLSLNWRYIWHSNHQKYIKHYPCFHVSYLKSTWLENRKDHIEDTDLGQWEVIWLVWMASWLSLVLKDSIKKVLVTNHTCKVGSSLLNWNTGSEKGETIAKESSFLCSFWILCPSYQSYVTPSLFSLFHRVYSSWHVIVASQNPALTSPKYSSCLHPKFYSQPCNLDA